jgi:hypothetical protein
MGKRRTLLRTAGPLALAISGTLLSAKIWVPVAFFLIDTFPENPGLASAVLSAICAVFILCIPGAKMRPKVGSFVSRAVLLFLSVVAAIASMEAISFGAVSVTVTPSREGFLWVLIAIALVAVCCLGLRAALDWHLSFWIIFPAVFVTLIVATFGASILSLL